MPQLSTSRSASFLFHCSRDIHVAHFGHGTIVGSGLRGGGGIGEGSWTPCDWKRVVRRSKRRSSRDSPFNSNSSTPHTLSAPCTHAILISRIPVRSRLSRLVKKRCRACIRSLSISSALRVPRRRPLSEFSGRFGGTRTICRLVIPINVPSPLVGSAPIATARQGSESRG